MYIESGNILIHDRLALSIHFCHSFYRHICIINTFKNTVAFTTFTAREAQKHINEVRLFKNPYKIRDESTLLSTNTLSKPLGALSINDVLYHEEIHYGRRPHLGLALIATGLME